MAEWKPAVIDEYMESLLKRGLFRQAMNERLAKVRGGEEREALARVDSYMTGFLSHECRKASRSKVRGSGGLGGQWTEVPSPQRSRMQTTLCFYGGCVSAQQINSALVSPRHPRSGVFFSLM